MRWARPALGLPAAWLVAEDLALTKLVPSPVRLSGERLRLTFFCTALGGAFLLHLASTLRGAVLVASALVLSTTFVLARSLPSTSILLLCGAAIGAGSIAVLAVQGAWAAPAELSARSGGARGNP